MLLSLRLSSSCKKSKGEYNKPLREREKEREREREREREELQQ
jgi:hypothetical protein